MARRGFATLLLFAIALGGAAAVAHAQNAAPAPAPVDPNAAPAADADAAPGSDATAGHLGNSKITAVMFWLFALLCVGGSVFVITRRNMISATMGLVGTFFAIAAVYVMLYAHFIAAIQVLVYAGAVMVLFVFVVMILNREEDEPWALHGLIGKGAAIVAMVYLLARVGQVLWRVRESAPAAMAQAQSGGHEFGTTKALGHTLFHSYLFPFEAVSLVLLIAVVGAIAVARPKEPGNEPGKEMDV
jgi:NADH-quinone oxidoreductase subunit J